MSTLAEAVSVVKPPVTESRPEEEKCEICGVPCCSLAPGPLALTWSLAWFSRGTIGSFRIAHVPARFPEERYTYDGITSTCVDPEKVSWITLKDLKALPHSFIMALAGSDVKISRLAAGQLAGMLDMGQKDIWRVINDGKEGRGFWEWR